MSSTNILALHILKFLHVLEGNAQGPCTQPQFMHCWHATKRPVSTYLDAHVGHVGMWNPAFYAPLQAIQDIASCLLAHSRCGSQQNHKQHVPVVIVRGWAVLQQLSVVKLKLFVFSWTWADGFISLPGRSPLTAMVAVMISLLAGGSVRLHENNARDYSSFQRTNFTFQPIKHVLQRALCTQGKRQLLDLHNGGC